MNELQKFEYITQWYTANSSEKVSDFKLQENINLILKVEELLGELMPREVKQIFTKYNGEDQKGCGRFIGHSLVSLEEVVRELEDAKSRSKPEKPYISNPEESERLVEALNAAYRSVVPEKRKWGILKQKWYKLIYDGSATSRGGPYFYRTKKTSDREREIIKLSNEQGSRIQGLLRDLQAHYNWDEVECSLYGDGSYSFERKFFDLNDGLSSFPENCIKTIYYHLGWLPIIKDHGGNFIGIDLDPDEKGSKGQVIVYGRDDMEMFVLAKSWVEFLDLVLGLIQNNPKDLLESGHLHDFFKGLIVQ